jgi:hypothetical protein
VERTKLTEALYVGVARYAYNTPAAAKDAETIPIVSHFESKYLNQFCNCSMRSFREIS